MHKFESINMLQRENGIMHFKDALTIKALFN